MTQDQLFFHLCQAVGGLVPNWVQGAGGNISCKFVRQGQQILRIKSSGYRLDQVRPTEGYVDLDRAWTTARLRDTLMHRDREGLYAELLGSGLVHAPRQGDRASMETCFHLLLETTWVLHFHALSAVLLSDLFFLDQSSLTSFLKRPGTPKCAFIKFAKPGLDLATAIMEAPSSEYYFLQNHGLVIATENPAALEEWKEWEHKLISHFGWESLEADVDGTAMAPLAMYFPDSIVFLRQILDSVVPVTEQPNFFQLDDGRDICESIREIWLATHRLYRTRPALKTIPEHLWDAVAGMPTEKFRLSFLKGHLS